MKNLIFTTLLFFLGQSLIWFQTNGQFMLEWVRKNPFFISILGIPISYIFIKATAYSQSYFGNLWSGRMVAFSMGVVSFTFLTWFFLGEPLNSKTLLTLFLSFLIIVIQLFY